jgi:hypothetical protein
MEGKKRKDRHSYNHVNAENDCYCSLGLDVLGQYDERSSKVGEHEKDAPEEVVVVSLADAVVDPLAVVIEFEATQVAFVTVA